MPRARWFPTARLNYAERLLAAWADRPADVALVAYGQTRPPIEVTAGELRDAVARVRAALLARGVGKGDRVAAYLPNIPETVVAFLACASIGAVWCSCATEFGPRSVIDRFSQVEPKVLLAVAGYRYGDELIDTRGRVAEVRDALTTVELVIEVPYSELSLEGADVTWPDLLAEAPADEELRLRAGALRPSARHPVLVRHDRVAQGDRARPRGRPPGAPQEPCAELGPRPR